jgi:hypothetical protein
MANNDSFSVILMRENGPEVAVEGGIISIDDASPEILEAYTTGRCDSCGMIHVLEGEIRHVATHERNMGRERIFVSDHWAECHCGTDLRLEIEYMEYPRNAMQPYQVRPISNVEYCNVERFGSTVNRAASQVREDQESLRASVRELQEMVGTGMLDVEDDPNFVSALDQLVETVANTVLVLGSHHGANKPELFDIRDELVDRGYDAHLFEDLPEFADKDLSSNVATAMRMVGFCVMIDREASGHIDEYRIADKQRTILARLTPNDSGSTRMIGGAELVDVNHIRSFEFDVRPQEKLDEAIEWAKELRQEREEAYDDHYDWRS